MFASGPDPVVDSFAWIIWNGLIQGQPWQWVDGTNDDHVFAFEGHILGRDEVDAYWPIHRPDPPAP